jgi:ferredoxin
MNATVMAKKPKSYKIAVIDPWCTGCGGSPVCRVYCKQKALRLIKDKEADPFSIMTVDGSLCIGCGACAAAGRQGIMLSGCPWNAIRIETRMVT